MLSWFWWCVLSGHYLPLGGLSDIVGLPGCVCGTLWTWIAGRMMDDSYYDGPLKPYVDDYHRMWSLNDNSPDTPVGLSPFDDSSIMPDVFGLRAFDTR